MKYKLNIEGMSCANCVRHVNKALSEMGGTGINVDLKSKCAYVEFEREVTDDEINTVIDDAGYELTGVAAVV